MKGKAVAVNGSTRGRAGGSGSEPARTTSTVTAIPITATNTPAAAHHRSTGPAPFCHRKDGTAGATGCPAATIRLDQFSSMASNMPGSYDPPCWCTMTAIRLAALIMATPHTSAAICSSS